MSEPCPRCGWIHSPDSVRVVGSRFSGPVAGYRSILGGPMRATRDEAMRDYCDTKRQPQPKHEPLAAPGPVAEQLPLFELPAAVLPSAPAPEFPADRFEVAAREDAWLKFLAQARLSLLVWQIDPSIHDRVEHVLTWLRRCMTELNDLMTPAAATREAP